MENLLYIPLKNFQKENEDDLILSDAKIVPSPSLDFLGKVKGWPQFALVANRTDKKPRATLNRALLRFKLFKDPVVDGDTIYYFKDDELKEDKLPHYVYWLHPDKELDPYILTRAEESEFVRIWESLSTINPGEFAASRFNLAHFRPFLMDRVVDYVLCLESLLVPDSHKGEIAFKFRLNGATLLGKGVEERIRIYKDLNWFYSLRSDIVHDNKKNKKKKIPKDHPEWRVQLSKLRDLCRRTIRHFHSIDCINDSEKRRLYLEACVLAGDPDTELIDSLNELNSYYNQGNPKIEQLIEGLERL